MIRDIIHSVSLIPDQITRTVYIQQIATRFGMSENVLSTELIKLRKGQLIKSNQEPAIEEIQVPVASEQVQAVTASTPSKNYHHEWLLLRLMVKYGARIVEIEQFDEEGKKFLGETSVLEWIHHELSKDELYLQHPLYAKVYLKFIEGLNENVLYTSAYLQRTDDQEIVQFISDVETETHELSSKWLINYRIETRTESDRLVEAVSHALYSFKAATIEEKIDEIRKKLAEEELEDQELMEVLAEQMVYEKLKIMFAEKLGRTILR